MKLEFDLEKLNQDDLEYYIAQFEKLQDYTTISFQVTDYIGNKTNNMSLNNESLVALLLNISMKTKLLDPK